MTDRAVPAPGGVPDAGLAVAAEPPALPDAPIVIIGTGLVGGSVGRALTRAGHRVHLIDQNPLHAQLAEQVGAGTIEPADPQTVRLVVAAVPPGSLADTITGALDRYPDATVTDVGSVKSGVLDRLWRSGADRSRYVGSHPMAGSQLSGPLTAEADLFVGRTWVITPHRASDPERARVVEALARTCGADVVWMDVVDHDTAVARVSHLPHLISGLVAGHLNDVPVDQLRLAGQGLRDVTRIAASDPGLWQQIIAENATALVPELKAVQRRLEALIRGLEADPVHGADRHLADGVRGTRRIPGKHGQAPVAYARVVVEISDEPGALGRLFADVAELGANIEDLAIQHDPARQVGYVTISVLAETGARVAGGLSDHGWATDLRTPDSGAGAGAD